MSGYLIKLVRDRMPFVVARNGDSAIAFRKIPYEDVGPLLRQKLIEEAAEYAVNPTIEELADVLEVVKALAAHAHGGQQALAVAAARKQVDRGGFRDGLGMYSAPPVEPL